MSASQAELLRQLSLDRDALPAGGGGGRRWLVALVLLAALAAAGFWFYGRAGTARQAAAAAVAGAPAVRVVPARAAAGAPPAAVLDASGYVVARRAATVSSKVTGKVLDVLIEEGQKVQVGQVLARLDPVNAGAQLDLARAQAEQVQAQAVELQVSLANAERDLTRQRDVFAKKLVSQAAVDNAETAVGQFRARLASVRKSVAVAAQQVNVANKGVDDTVIRAPFTGVVTVKNAQPGEMISPLSGGGSSFTRSGIGTLVDMNSQEIEVDVAESFIGKVVSGAPVRIKLNAYPDADLRGNVIAIVPTADRAKATVKVRVAFARDAAGSLDPRILPEMGARVSFLEAPSGDAAAATPKTGVFVPAEALRGEGAGTYLLVAENGKARRVALTPGVRLGDAVHVAAGVAPGTGVVVGEAVKEGDTLPAAATAAGGAAP